MIGSKSTKEQILELLKEHGNMTIMELATIIGITEMAVRRHIQTLEREKMISSVIKKQTMGRPSKVYQLAENGENFFPKKYKEFCLELLSGLRELGHDHLIKEIVQKRKQRLLESNKKENRNESVPDRLERLKRIQEYEGFMPQIEIENGELHFKEMNCPFIELAKEFPEICQAEIEFMKEFLKTDELKTLSNMAAGQACCHYSIRITEDNTHS